MQAHEHSPALYREVQRLRQWWIWLVVIAISLLCFYAVIQQLIFREPFGQNPPPDWLLLLFWFLFGLGLPLLLFSAHLITEVRIDGLYIKYVPFHFRFKHFPLKQLKTYQERTCRPILEYGGWGIRYGQAGWAYNVSGNRGVQLELVSGKRVLIGSQNPEQIVRALDQLSGGH